MQSNYFDTGFVQVGGKDVPFEKITVQNKIRMYVPQSFEVDTSLTYRYTYLSNKGKSPLGIALKHVKVSSGNTKEKMIENYFGEGQVCEKMPGASGSKIQYRETVNAGQEMSIYSLRFSIETEGGLLFGCFNTSAAYKDDWKEPVLHMLESIETIESAAE